MNDGRVEPTVDSSEPNSVFIAHREHEFHYGHSVTGHEGKCIHLHGHSGKVTFYCEAGLDSIGRVIDFSVIKARLCMWLEENWDHKFLLFEEDPRVDALREVEKDLVLPLNPTAENLAYYLLNVVGPQQLNGTGVRLRKVTFMETAKCGADAILRS
jgi:6-pyruvoyltetrahydropterin/6-carboxytetrahydropterin synthase